MLPYSSAVVRHTISIRTVLICAICVNSVQRNCVIKCYSRLAYFYSFH